LPFQKLHLNRALIKEQHKVTISGSSILVFSLHTYARRKKGKSAHLHIFFLIGPGGTAHVFDTNHKQHHTHHFS
jgi:hypothetical protein